MKTFLMYLILALVTLSSACTGTNGTSPNALVINEIGFSEQKVTDKDVVTFVFEVQNQGTKDITFAKAFFYGLPNVNVPAQVITATSPLKAPTREGAEGNRFRNSFELDLLRSGFDFPQGTEQTYELQTRIVYNYTAEANTAFTTLTREAYIQEKQRGKDPKSRPIELHTIPGPIQMTIKTEQPLIFYTEGGKTNATLLFHIENIGDGIPVPQFDEASDLSNLNIRKTNSLGKLTVLLNKQPIPCTDKEVPLFNNEAEIYCRISLDTPIIEEEYHLEAELPYYYIVDRTTPLTIQGTRSS